MEDEEAGRSPRMLGWDGIGGAAEANDPAAQPGVERHRVAHEPDLDIAYAGDDYFLPCQLEAHQCHDDSACGAAVPANSAEEIFQRLIEVALDILPGCVRGALGKLSMAQAVNDASEGVALPLPDDEGVAIFWH